MIIGVSGKIASGKDLVGRIIQFISSGYRLEDTNEFELMLNGGVFDDTFVCKKFADALKENVCILLGVDRERLEDRGYKETPLSEEWWYYRSGDKILPYGYYKGEDKEIADKRFLVKPTPRLILQRLGTEGVRETIHPNAWVNAAMSTYNGQNWVFTDMRFPNEFEAVYDRGGLTIRVERGDGHTGSHPSEVALDSYIDSFDRVIDNNGSIEDLYYKVEQAMKEFNLI